MRVLLSTNAMADGPRPDECVPKICLFGMQPGERIKLFIRDIAYRASTHSWRLAMAGTRLYVNFRTSVELVRNSRQAARLANRQNLRALLQQTTERIPGSTFHDYLRKSIVHVTRKGPR